MSSFQLFLFFLTSFGISIALLFSLVLFRLERRPPFANQLLALLLFCLSMRISKSVFYNFVELPLFIKNLGLAFNLAVGPLLLLYGYSLLADEFRFSKRTYLHFIPSGIFFIACGIIPNSTAEVGWYISYSGILLQSFIYVFLSWRLWTKKENVEAHKGRWYLYLTAGLGLMWGVYLLIFAGLLPVYLAGAFSFSLLVGLLAYWVLMKKNLLTNVFYRKYKSSNLEEIQSQKIMKKIRHLLEEEQLFLNPKLSLNDLAEKVNTSDKILSQVINESTAYNFTQFINSYRIDHAKKMFLNPQTKDDKVIAIAFESGFNSLSAFNVVFKQQVGMTPSQFRKAV